VGGEQSRLVRIASTKWIPYYDELQAESDFRHSVDHEGGADYHLARHAMQSALI